MKRLRFHTCDGGFDKINHALSAFHRCVLSGKSDVLMINTTLQLEAQVSIGTMFTSSQTPTERLKVGNKCYLWKEYTLESCKDDPELQEGKICVCSGCTHHFKRIHVLLVREGFMCKDCIELANPTRRSSRITRGSDLKPQFRYSCARCRIGTDNRKSFHIHNDKYYCGYCIGMQTGKNPISYTKRPKILLRKMECALCHSPFAENQEVVLVDGDYICKQCAS